MYKTSSLELPVSVSTLQKNQSFFISRNLAPSINKFIYNGAFFGMCHSTSEKGTMRIFKPHLLVYPVLNS